MDEGSKETVSHKYAQVAYKRGRPKELKHNTDKGKDDELNDGSAAEYENKAGPRASSSTSNNNTIKGKGLAMNRSKDKLPLLQRKSIK